MLVLSSYSGRQSSPFDMYTWVHQPGSHIIGGRSRKRVGRRKDNENPGVDRAVFAHLGNV